MKHLRVYNEQPSYMQNVPTNSQGNKIFYDRDIAGRAFCYFVILYGGLFKTATLADSARTIFTTKRIG